MIGVLAVILATAVGSGAQVSVENTIAQFGSNMALVFPQPDTENGGPSHDAGKLTERDARAIERSVPGVMAIAPQLRASIQLSIPARRISTGGIGVTEGYGTVTNTDVELGRMVTAADVQAAARVIVLGPIRSRPSCSAISTRRGRASASTGCRSGSWGCSRRKAPALATTMTMSLWCPSAPRANASPPP
jgi:ABC-type antimicrobial peptide transport system permease subunit